MSGNGNGKNYAAWVVLVFWMCNNMGMTLVNKLAFSKLDFHYPYCLSAVHMAFNALGCQYIFWVMDRNQEVLERVVDKKQLGEHPIVRLLGHIQRKQLDRSGERLMLAFSVIFSMNSK